jgi:hypothetical protein
MPHVLLGNYDYMNQGDDPRLGVSVGAFWQGPFQNGAVTVVSRRRQLLNADPDPRFILIMIKLTSGRPNALVCIGAIGKIADLASLTHANIPSPFQHQKEKKKKKKKNK